MKEELEKLKIAFPTQVSRTANATCQVNPYEEFTHNSLEKYYSEYSDIRITAGAYNSMTLDEKYSFVVGKLEKHLDNVSHSSIVDEHGVHSIVFTNGDEEICRLSVDKASYIVSDSMYGEDRMHIVVDFRFNGCFDEMFDDTRQYKIETAEKAKISGQLICCNDVPGTDCQLAFSLCLVTGLLRFDKFLRDHKKVSIIVNGIDSYLKTAMEPLPGEYRTSYENDKMYIIYVPDGKYDKQTTKVGVILYKNYAKEIDEFIEKLITK